MKVYPDYYKNFRCIAENCTHSCCVGWEIDIDEKSLESFMKMGGSLGEKLKRSISLSPTPHFVLGEGERCPFLNSLGLCEIIIECGEEALCEICRLHPRFQNQLPGRTEIGLGMCCEAAAKLILTKKDKTVFNSFPCDDQIITLRDNFVKLLQNREKPLPERLDEMLSASGAALPDKSLSEWAKVFLSLERLDQRWTDCLSALFASIDFKGFDEYMKGRETEYEQLAVYFLYRHFASSPDLSEAKARAAFVALAYKIIYSLGAAQFTRAGSFSVDEQVEICRLFSSEIEYSTENTDLIFDLLYYDDNP